MIAHTGSGFQSTLLNDTVFYPVLHENARINYSSCCQCAKYKYELLKQIEYYISIN